MDGEPSVGCACYHERKAGAVARPVLGLHVQTLQFRGGIMRLWQGPAWQGRAESVANKPIAKPATRTSAAQQRRWLLASADTTLPSNAQFRVVALARASTAVLGRLRECGAWRLEREADASPRPRQGLGRRPIQQQRMKGHRTSSVVLGQSRSGAGVGPRGDGRKRPRRSDPRCFHFRLVGWQTLGQGKRLIFRRSLASDGRTFGYGAPHAAPAAPSRARPAPPQRFRAPFFAFRAEGPPRGFFGLLGGAFALNFAESVSASLCPASCLSHPLPWLLSTPPHR